MLLFCVKITRTVLRVDTGVRMVGRLGIHEGGQGASGKKDAEMDFSGGVKHWDKFKLRTALEWVVLTSSRTARLELTKVLDAVKNGVISIWASGLPAD